VHAAVDTLGNLLALHVSPANEQDRGRVEELAEAIQEATGESVELAHVDQGYTGEKAAKEAEAHAMRLELVRHEEAKRGFLLLPRRWVVERDFAWASRFRRLAKDYERLPATLAGLHFVVFACLFLQQAIGILTTGSYHALAFTTLPPLFPPQRLVNDQPARRRVDLAFPFIHRSA
jgi:transposase